MPPVIPSRMRATAPIVPAAALTACLRGYGANLVRSRGKSVVSRMLCASTRRATKRSNPIAKPPWGGIPWRNASDRTPLIGPPRMRVGWWLFRRHHAKRRVWSVRVVVVTPVGDEDLRFGEAVEQLDGEQLVADTGAERLDVRVLPGRAGLARPASAPPREASGSPARACAAAASPASSSLAHKHGRVGLSYRPDGSQGFGPGSRSAIGSATGELHRSPRTKSDEYELHAAWHAERAPLDDEHLAACQAVLVVGIVLRELADILQTEE